MDAQGLSHEAYTEVSSTANGLFISCFLCTIILGLSIVQSWSYFRRNKDRWIMHAFVFALMCVGRLHMLNGYGQLNAAYRSLDILESTLNIAGLNDYLIVHFGDFAHLHTLDPLLSVAFGSTSITTFLTHLFFAKRIYLVCRRKWLLVVNLTLCVITLGLGIVISITRYLPALRPDPRQPTFAIVAAHCSSMLSDVIITVALTLSLSDIRTSAKDFRAGSTKDLLHQVLVYTVTRGIVMTVVQGLHITMFIAKPKDFMFWTSTHFIISKLYVLTTLVTLNSRRNTHKTDNVKVIPAEMPETFSIHFADRDSIDETVSNEELEKARMIQSAPAWV